MTIRIGAACPTIDCVPLRMFVAVTCDLCGGSVVSCRGYLEMRSWLTSHGWIERNNGEFHCPSCVGGKPTYERLL